MYIKGSLKNVFEDGGQLTKTKQKQIEPKCVVVHVTDSDGWCGKQPFVLFKPAQRCSIPRAPPLCSIEIEACVVLYLRPPCLRRNQKCEKQPSVTGELHAKNKQGPIIRVHVYSWCTQVASTGCSLCATFDVYPGTK